MQTFSKVVIFSFHILFRAVTGEEDKTFSPVLPFGVLSILLSVFFFFLMFPQNINDLLRAESEFLIFC